MSRIRRAGRVTADVVLVALGLLGLSVVGWLVFAQLTGATLVVFKTGSMSPTIPAGGAAVSLPTAAEDLQVGDVVTVQREAATLPVTHRIVEIHRTGTPDERELVLQGDANQTADLEPYVVREVPRVVLSGAGWGTAVTAAQSPMALGALTLLVAGMCLRAFWPSGEARHRARREGT